MPSTRILRNGSPCLHVERACAANCPAARPSSPSYGAWIGYMAGGASLLFEKGLQRLFGLFSPVGTTTRLFSAPLDIVVAEIGPLFIENAFGRDFLTFIVSVLVVKVTLLTTT